MENERWYYLRLWVVSAALFLCVFAGRIYIDAQGDTAALYPLAVQFQWFGYGAALLVLLVWIASRPKFGQRLAGCILWAVLAFASTVAIFSSVPK